MAHEIKIAIVGLDTSHSIEFTKRLQAPDCPAEMRVPNMKVVSCLRFETPFQNKEGLDARQAQLESWGVKVTERLPGSGSPNASRPEVSKDSEMNSIFAEDVSSPTSHTSGNPSCPNVMRIHRTVERSFDSMGARCGQDHRYVTCW